MPENKPTKEELKSKKARNKLLFLAAGLLLLNFGFFFVKSKIDLTRDQRYTLTSATKNLLRDLPKETHLEVLVFLKGEELPAAFKKLARSTEELLEEFRDLSHQKVTFRFIDPLGDDTIGLGLLKAYHMQGVPVTISAGKKGSSQKMLFPWALVTLKDDVNHERGFPVFLQETNTPQLSRSVLLRSEMLLEYNLAQSIHQITQKEPKQIAYLTGNKEPFGYGVLAAISSLSRFYLLDTLNLQNTETIPDEYQAVFINNPQAPFSEIDKYKIDQYLNRGGKILLSIDGATGTLDSFSGTGRFNSMALILNLDDWLYHHGLRLNHNIMQDAVSSAGIPLMAKGNNPEPVIYPWVYYPVLQAGSDHPIVKNLNGVLGRFVSTLDPNANDLGIKKTPLLVSSEYSESEPTPAPILLESAMLEINPATFTKKKLVAAVLMEGAFPSFYSHRQPEELRAYLQANGKTVQAANQPGKMIICSDGDLFLNEFSEAQGPSDLGMYRYSDYQFDNKTFLLNCMEYLTDPNNLLEARAKRYEKQLLDPQLMEKERSKWQWINTGIPIALMLALAMVFITIRKRKYTD